MKQVSREKNRLDDKELAKNMLYPYLFIDETIKRGFKINLENHNINHANPFLTTTSNYPEFGIEFRYVN